MDIQSNRGAAALVKTFHTPVVVVVMVCQMLLGAGLAVTLILKVYMGIFSDYVCSPDATTLGNTIRCTQSLEIVAQFLILVAGFRFAAVMFTSTVTRMLDALLLALVGVFLLFLSDLTMAQATWFVSLIILALFATIGSVFAAIRFFGSTKEPQ